MQQPAEGSLVGGRYRIRKLLGRGGMGSVYEASQEDLGRLVAVKLLRGNDPTGTIDPSHLDRFEREARAAASLGSPHIIQIYDFCVPDGQAPFLVMELLTGETLQQAVRSGGPMAQERVARIGLHVLSALDAAHRHAIVHRDIKPANIFLTPTATLGEVAKVLDFGIAKISAARKITREGAVVGTLAYMSPEQVSGDELDARADIYSLSMSLYEALVGRNPLSGSTFEDAYKRIMDGAFAPLSRLRPDVDPKLAEIIATGMAALRELRFPTASLMAAALEAWLAGASPRPPVSPSPSLPAPNPLSTTVQVVPMAARASNRPQESVARATPSIAPASRGPSKLWLFLLVLLAGAALLLVAIVGGATFFFGTDLSSAITGASAPSAIASSNVSDGGVATPPAGAVDSSSAALPGGPPSASGLRPGAPGGTPPSTVPAGPNPSSTPATNAKKKSCAEGCADQEECVNGTCVCKAGNTDCGGVCVTLSSNPYHCGACGNVCKPNTHCSNGRCQTCDPPWGFCNGRCINLQNDAYNCGACGKKCPPDICFMGQCQKAPGSK